MKCPTCAAQIEDSANFCPSCGRLVRQAEVPQEGRRIPTWLIVLIVVGALFVIGLPFIAIVAAILIPNFLHARALSQMVADQANLKQIAVAIEEYAVDHQGRYPTRLGQLLPTYLKSIPDVPGPANPTTYAYHKPAVLSANAKYDIWDNGSMDPTTFSKLTRAVTGGPCDGCKYVVYLAGSGIVGTPYLISRNRDEKESRFRTHAPTR